MAAKVKVLMSSKQAAFWKAFLAVLEDLAPIEKEKYEDDEDEDDGGEDSDEDEEDSGDADDNDDDGGSDSDDDADDDEGDDEDADDEEDEKPKGKGKKGKSKGAAGPTLADVMNGFKKLAKSTGGKKAGIAILKKLKVKAPSEIEEEDYGKVLKLLKAAN